MNRIHILVEGQTEETFVRDLLNPHFWLLGIDLTPVIVATKRVKSGRKFKGGVTSYQKVKNDIVKLLGDSSAIAITTMLDYYKLPTSFPGYSELPDGTCHQKVEFLTQEFQENVNDSRFLPFLTLHEFEALLFVAPEQIARAFPSSSNLESKILAVKDNFRSPEEINEGDNTHPAARIQALVGNYQKAFHGPLIAKRTSLTRIRSECEHFDSWITRLEQYST